MRFRFYFDVTERGKNAHRIISDKQNGILLPSRFAAFRLSAIRQTISRKPGLIIRKVALRISNLLQRLKGLAKISASPLNLYIIII